MNRGYTAKEGLEMGESIMSGLIRGFEKAMNPLEDGFDGQADIEVDSNGKKWVYCPWCHKKHFPINDGAIIIGLQYRCRNSHCKKVFIIGE